MVQSILEKTTYINPFNMTNITGFVYFYSKGIPYPTIFDEYLNLTVHGAVIKRHVQYCQYLQKAGSYRLFGASSEIDTYPTKWVSEYINSSDFFDKNYVNPPLNVVVNETITFNSIKVGNLTISSSFYTDNLIFYYFEPDELGVVNFTYSNASSDFEFIRKGFFYHSAINKSPIKQLEKIEDKIRKGNEKYDDVLFKSQMKLFEKCHSGDVRIRYVLYAPLNSTYFGYVENYTLKAKIIDGIRFGTTKRGIERDLKSMVQAFTPDGQYDNDNDDDTLSEILIFPKNFLKLKIAFQTWRIIATYFIDDSLKSCYWVIAVALANFAYRSLIWDVWYLDFSIWSTTLLTFLSVGYMLGVWKIPIERLNPNNRNRN